MAEMRESYASPNLRWALLLEDHPSATHSFRVGRAEEFGVPPDFGGDQQVVVCTIIFPAESGLQPSVAYKEVTDSKGRPIPQSDWDPATWNVLTTKALGRACKRAGYPDSLPELKALVHWRQRTAEVEALVAGRTPLAALGPGHADQALDAAAVADPEHVSHDPDETPPGVDPETGEVNADNVPADAVVIDEGEPDEHALTVLAEAIEALPAKAKTELARWAKKEHDIGNVKRPPSAALAVTLTERARQLAAA